MKVRLFNQLCFLQPSIHLHTKTSSRTNLTNNICRRQSCITKKPHTTLTPPLSCLESSVQVDPDKDQNSFPPNGNRPASKIPNHFRIPILGLFVDTLLFNRSNLDLSRKYGPIYTTDMIGMPVTVVSHPQTIISCLKDAKTFTSVHAFPVMFEKLFGQNMMMMSDGKDHTKKRARVSPAFTSEMIPAYFHKIHSAALNLWNSISDLTAASPTSEPLPLESSIRSHFLQVIVSITTGAFSNTDNESVSRQAERLRSQFVTISYGANSPPFGPTWNKAKQARQDLLAMLRELTIHRVTNYSHIIDALRRDGEAAAKRLFKNRQVDLLMIIIAASNLSTAGTDTGSIDKAELELITELIVEIWFGGYFSSTSATLSSLMELQANPHILQQLREEQASIPKLTVEAVTKEMPLLHSFLMEVLRIHCPVYLWYRRTTRPTKLLGFEIPKDTHILLDLWSAQRDPEYFANPNEFDHLRFVQRSKESPPVSPLLSFGAVGSSHYCIGAALAKVSLKTTLAVLIRHFDLNLVPRTSLDYLTIPEFRPKQGVRAISCEKRL